MRTPGRPSQTIALLATAALAIGGCQRAGEPASRQPAPSARPIPAAGPLAAPKSLQQIGTPLAATQAAAGAAARSPDEVALGEKLFFDGRLSLDGTVACSTCHDPARAFTDGRAVSMGIKGRLGQRNAPTVLNALYNKTQFWDGRAKTLEDQAALPILNPVEMGQPSLDAAAAAIGRDPAYQPAFRKVFGRAPNGPDLVQAIAAYERTQFSFDAPFDRFMAGDKTAIGEPAKRGWEVFNGRGNCNKCHALTDSKRDPSFFTDNDFHNIGVGIIRHDVVALACKAQAELNSGDALAVDQAAIQTEMSALGRFLVTKKPADIAAFKSPNLRNVVMTAPYFHDGSHATLWDVLDHYNKGDGIHNPWLDADLRPLALSETDIDDMVAFMASLTSAPYRDPADKELARQRALAGASRPQRDVARAFAPKVAEPAPALACAQKR